MARGRGAFLADGPGKRGGDKKQISHPLRVVHGKGGGAKEPRAWGWGRILDLGVGVEEARDQSDNGIEEQGKTIQGRKG